MSDLPTGAYAPGPSTPDGNSKAQQVAGQSKQAATQAAVEVKDTAMEQAQRVGAEAKTQARGIATDVRDKVGEHARTQNDKLVSTIRQTADQLDEMRGDRQDSPAATVVSRVADGGRQLADYLDRNGPEGVLQEVQDFARRRPGAFLATALAAGFVVGRLGKSVAKADATAGTSANAKPSSDAFVSQTSASGTDFASATGAGAAYTGAPATTGTVYTGVPAGQYATGTGYTEAPAGTYATTGSDYTGVPTGQYATGTGYTEAPAGQYPPTGTGAAVVAEDPYQYQEPRP